VNEKFCQSCGMPLSNEQLLGSEAGGQKSQDYCLYCYEKGVFKQPDISLEEMIAICIPFMQEHGMEEKQARTLLEQNLPRLKRWAK